MVTDLTNMVNGAWAKLAGPPAQEQVPSVAGFEAAAALAHPTQFPSLTFMGVWG